MCGIVFLVLKSTTILLSVSPCDLWIVFAAAGRSGNCFLTTCAVLFLPTANCVVTGFTAVHVCSIPCTYKCLFSCLVFWPTSEWSNCTHTIPDGLVCWCNWTSLTTFPAPFVMTSSVRTFMTRCVLSPSARQRVEANCFVFLGSLGICLSILLLSSGEIAPIALSRAFIVNLFPVAALWALWLNSSTLAFCINKWGASIGLLMSSCIALFKFCNVSYCVFTFTQPIK